MRKKVVALLVILVLVLAGGTTVLGMTIVSAIEQKQQDEKLKAENEKAFITELFHDQGHIYMTPDEPMEGENVTLRLRTVRYNVTRAQIQYTTNKGENWNVVDMEFEKQDDTGYYDIWKGEIPAEGDLIYYRFIAGNTDVMSTVYYDTRGVNITEGDYSQGWQIVPGHTVPEWAKGALWYSILPDAFYNGNTTNDKQISGANTYVTWNKQRKGLGDKYGGDLEGIESKLDYIESLHVDAVYTNPVFKSYQNAGYGPVHFDEVESSFGNEEDLAELSDALHERGLYFMGDVVLTFAREESYYFNKDGRWPVTGAAQSEDSEWNEMFQFFNFPDNYMITWESPAIDLNTDAARDLLYAKEDSYLRKYAKYYDGYRFDCGGWLWGTSDTDDVEAYTFIKEIREALRSEDEDFYLLTEADWGNMNTGTWDSAWNIDYMPKLQDYAKGLINETLMLEAMYSQEMTIPRNVALCLTNMMCDHDDYRVEQHDDYMYNAAVLIQMTYLGSPSIYYGEEIDLIREAEDGVGSTQSFYAMEWDETNWNNARLNFYKACGELREAYPCVKTGVVNILGSNDQDNTLMFGRWDETGAAITVTSQNEDVITVEIPVRKCDIPDGTIMTDWYTGAQYEVRDGVITADVIPGGTVFVTGKKSSSYRQTYEVTAIGNTSKKNEVTTTNSLSFKVDGKGTINKKKDTFTFINASAHDDFAVFANLRGDGKGALMIRNSLEENEAYYAAVIDDNELSILTRDEAGGNVDILVKVKCTKNTYVKLERTADNTFNAYKAEVTDGNLSAWELIEGSSKKINMNNKVYYGFTPLKGEMKVNNVTFEQLEKECTFDTFDDESYTSLFDNINADFVSTEKGKLTITNSKKDSTNYLLANAMEDDWTFKTKLTYSSAKDGYAGLVSYQDANNYVVTGRTTIGNKSVLFLGKVIQGELAIYASVEESEPEQDIVIQLQRIGAYYSAVYSTDDGASWEYIGRVFSNFSDEHPGIIVSGKTSASFDWVSFGDSINDGVSTNTPHTPIDVDTTYNDQSIEEECKYEFLTGNWSVVTGGWNQSQKDTFANAAATNKEFSGLYAEATIDITDGDGWAGFGFGKKSYDSDDTDGFTLQYYDKGKLVLMNGSQQLGECELDVSKKDAVRIVVEAFDGQIIIYAGQDAVPVINVKETGYSKGYVAFYTNGVTAEFRNFYHGSTNVSWNWISGYGRGLKNLFSTSDSSSNERQIHTIATLTGYSFTNFVCTAKLTFTKTNEDLAGASGILLCASEGKSASVDGVFVYLDGNGRLVLDADGAEKASYELPDSTSSVSIMVVKQNGVYQVFLSGQDEPVLKYSEEFNRGGVLSLYTINGSGAFFDVDIENLQISDQYTESRIAKNFGNTKNENFSDSFDSTESADNYIYYYDAYATYEIANGVLSCYDSTDWVAGATVAENTYSDFVMEFKLRIDSEEGGWMSVGMRKNIPDGHHNNSGVSLMIKPDGTIFFFDSKTMKDYSYATIKNFKVGEWNDVKIVANGSTITAYVNGEKLATYTDETHKNGFISFTSGMQDFSVDDLKIRTLE